MGVDEKLILLAVDKASPRRRGRPEIETQVGEVIQRGSELAERRILALILQNPDLVARVRSRLSLDDFEEEGHRRVAGHLLAVEEGEAVEPARLMNSMTDLGLESLIAELCFLDEKGQVERLLEDYVRNLEAKRLLREEQRVKEQLREAEKGSDEALVHQLTQRLSQIARQRYQSTSPSP